jgi:multidrug efflux pump subunit AcrA (membrane-fusion protein)
MNSLVGLSIKNRRVVLIMVIVVAELIGGYYDVRPFTDGNYNPLVAAGTIEATTVDLSPELVGKVKEVLVDEEQVVETGDPLNRLYDTLLNKKQAAGELGVSKSAAQRSQASYAIKLKVNDPQGQLKLGLPADAVFCTK